MNRRQHKKKLLKQCQAKSRDSQLPYICRYSTGYIKPRCAAFVLPGEEKYIETPFGDNRSRRKQRRSDFAFLKRNNAL